MSRVFLIEDHDEALEVWRRNKIRGMDLVHVDAHMDFGYYQAHSAEDIIRKSRSLTELKKGLEQSIAFNSFESDFEKQLNIGNYIYPAMREGIVNNFYWVIPGDNNEFAGSVALIKNTLKEVAGNGHWKFRGIADGVISFDLLDRKLFVCCLERMPSLKQGVLLDIDTDFMVISAVRLAANTQRIRKRKPWILPQDLAEKLKIALERPEIVTVAYSVNGGYTPIIYKHFGDEIAYCFDFGKSNRRLKRNIKAAKYFNLFNACGRKVYYDKAIAFNRTYRAPDNNYGPLYLALGEFLLAEKEFLRILRVDADNPACLLGLGNIALGRRDFKKSKRRFRSAFISAGKDKVFYKIRNECLLGLAEANLWLNNLQEAKKQLLCYKTIEPLRPRAYYLLGCIFEKEKDYAAAALFYRDANRLGFNSIDVLSKLLEASLHCEEMDGIIKYVNMSYAVFRKYFLRMENLEKKGKIGVDWLGRTRDKMSVFEDKLRNAMEKGE